MDVFHNEQIPIDALPKYELVTFVPLEKQYMNIIYFNILVFLLLLGGGIITMYFFTVFIKEQLLWVLGGYFVVALLVFYINTISFSKRGYVLRDKDMIYRRGILSTNTTIIPVNRVQHVAIHEGIISRIYGLSEIQIFTAGGGEGNLNIPGLLKSDAENIKEFLLNKINNEVLQQSREVDIPFLNSDTLDD